MNIPDFIIEMSAQMNSDDNRSTSNPFWQVRCKRKYATEAGINDSGFWVTDADSDFVFDSQIDDIKDFYNFLEENHPKFLNRYLYDIYELQDDDDNFEFFCDSYCMESDDLPNGFYRTYYQEIEEVVSTHLTESDAEWFIKRKQHDYPKLYTYVESAYWSPQLKSLQDWIKSLTLGKKNG